MDVVSATDSNCLNSIHVQTIMQQLNNDRIFLHNVILRE